MDKRIAGDVDLETLFNGECATRGVTSDVTDEPVGAIIAAVATGVQEVIPSLLTSTESMLQLSAALAALAAQLDAAVANAQTAAQDE